MGTRRRVSKAASQRVSGAGCPFPKDVSFTVPQLRLDEWSGLLATDGARTIPFLVSGRLSGTIRTGPNSGLSIACELRNERSRSKFQIPVRILRRADQLSNGLASPFAGSISTPASPLERLLHTGLFIGPSATLARRLSAVFWRTSIKEASSSLSIGPVN
jgi:hypothetical protein